MSTYLKYLTFLVLSFLFLVLGMIGFNACFQKPTADYQVNQCSRYCYFKGCPHFAQKSTRDASTGILTPNKIQKWYEAHIRFLKNNPFGLSYRDANLLIYVFLFPIINLILIFKILRLKQQNR